MTHFFPLTTKELWLASMNADLLKHISSRKPKETAMASIYCLGRRRLLHIPFVTHQLCILQNKPHGLVYSLQPHTQWI